MPKSQKNLDHPGNSSQSNLFQKTLSRIVPPDQSLRPMAQATVDAKTKPLGSLGVLEDIAVQASIVQQGLKPAANNKLMLTFAGDHGIAGEGVSAYPPEVTAQMVRNFCTGGAAINVFCNQNHIDLWVVDMGVKFEVNPHKLLIDKKVSPGTKNFALEPAMTQDQALQAIENGMQVVLDLVRQKEYQLIGLGEMGIGNTSSATAIIAAGTGRSVQEVCGRGTGIDEQIFRHKMAVLQKALALHKPDPANGLDILQKVGGFEIAGMTGAALAAASQGIMVVLDGLISTAAGLLSVLINPDIKHYLIAGHKSVEQGHAAALDFLELNPVLNLDLRLGEGTGAALSMGIIESACRMMSEMATFASAGVSEINAD